MAVKLSSTITYHGGVVQTLPEFPAMLKQALADAIVLYHQKFLHRHFGTPAEVAALYPGIYQPRSTRYMKRKAAEKGHQRMLMWGGDSAASVLSAITITGTYKEVRGRMKGANKNFNFSGVDKLGRRKPMMGVELTYTNDAESQEQVEIVDKNVQAFLDKETPVTTVEIR